MSNNINFDDIRPYSDHEVNDIVNQLANEQDFLRIAGYFFPKIPQQLIVEKLKNINSIYQFQSELIKPLVNAIEKFSTNGLSVSGIENIKKEENYLFISNHRDIVLDSAFLNILLYRNDFDTTEIAIGNNLLIYPWITKLVRLNKSFLVKRNVPVKQIFEYSAQLSNYIRYALTGKKSSVWLAQREGRTKNGHDQTQISLLKMLNISGENSVGENFEQLNIVPVSISYEYESCDLFKVQELYDRKINPDYKKSVRDDLLGMAKGIQSPKGRVHFNICQPLNQKLDTNDLPKNKNQAMGLIAEKIDNAIHSSFKLWPNNYIANDIVNKTERWSDKYQQTDKENFEAYLDKQIARMRGNANELRDLYLKIYSTPVDNQHKNQTNS